MKFTCAKSVLLSGVQTVAKAVPSKTTMSLLECVLIEARDVSVKLIANDKELGIETIIDAKVEEKGIVALDAKIFQEIVRKLPDNDITIYTDENLKTIITCENAKFTLIGKSGDEFAYLPVLEKNDSIVISQFSLKEVIRQTLFSVADNDNNKQMTGELFEVNEDTLRVVALDGHRIAVRKIHLKNSYDKKKVIVQGKTLNEISKILPGDTEKEVEIFFTDKHIVFEFDRTTVVSRLIEGEYFNIDQMLSSDYETKVKVNKKDFVDCIDRGTLLIKESDKKPVIIDINDTSMKMDIHSTIGSLDEVIDAEKTGKDITIGFNPKFLIDALRVIDDENVEMYLVNPKAPCFIKDAEGSYIYMVLPINFSTVS